MPKLRVRPAAGEPTGQPVRVAHVVTAFKVGGMERGVARLVSHLDRRRFQPFVVCMVDTQGAERWLTAPDVTLVELGKRPGNDPRVVARMARALRRHRIDIVHSHNWGTLIETLLARRLAKTPLHLHGEHNHPGVWTGRLTTFGGGAEVERISRMRRQLRSLATRWALARVDAVVTVAEAIRTELLARYRLRQDVRVIPNGVEPVARLDGAGRAALRQSLAIPSDAFVVGSVGRLEPVKHLACAVEALARLGASGTDAYLVVVGGGTEEDRLRSRARALGVGHRLRLVGYQSMVVPWLSIMDAFLNVSVSEGMSNAILEAMSIGLPVVATEVGDTAALVGGDEACGLLVPIDDPAAVAQALERLRADPALANQLGLSALQRVESRYRTETMVRAFERLYGELVAGRPVGASCSAAGDRVVKPSGL